MGEGERQTIATQIFLLQQLVGRRQSVAGAGAGICSAAVDGDGGKTLAVVGVVVRPLGVQTAAANTEALSRMRLSLRVGSKLANECMSGNMLSRVRIPSFFLQTPLNLSNS